MHITLDGEQWHLPDDTSLMNALAFLSDKAHAQHRIVTSLTVGGGAISDRDLDPAFLNQRCGDVGEVSGRSQSLHAIITDAKQAIDRFAAQLRADGLVLLGPLRSGTGQVRTIDAWLGRLADYTEMLEPDRCRASQAVVRSAPPVDTRTPRRANLRRPHPGRGPVGV
jgi:hypothetical protein